MSDAQTASAGAAENNEEPSKSICLVMVVGSGLSYFILFIFTLTLMSKFFFPKPNSEDSQRLHTSHKIPQLYEL